MTTEVRELVEFIVERYMMTTNPVYVSVPKSVAEYYDSRGSIEAPPWALRRMPIETRINCRRLLPQIQLLLETEFGLTVCPVNWKIWKTKLISHGQDPTLDGRCRTSDFYRRAYTLSGTGNWADGMVVFPPDSSIDHPCNANRSRQKVESASNRLLRERNNVQALHRKHLISDVTMQASLGTVAVADTRRQIEGPTDAESGGELCDD